MLCLMDEAVFSANVMHLNRSDLPPKLNPLRFARIDVPVHYG